MIMRLLVYLGRKEDLCVSDDTGLTCAHRGFDGPHHQGLDIVIFILNQGVKVRRHATGPAGHRPGKKVKDALSLCPTHPYFGLLK